MTMNEKTLDVTAFIYAPMELVRERVGQYVAGGYDCVAMREIVSFVLSELVWLTLTAQLTLRSYVQIGDCSLTLDEANTRIADLRALPLF